MTKLFAREIVPVFDAGCEVKAVRIDYRVCGRTVKTVEVPVAGREAVSPKTCSARSREVRNAKERRLSGASSPRSGQNENRLAQLERQRRNLLFLLCRVLAAAPGYRLRPSELAAESVGDLSCLSQESAACLRNRMVRDSAFQNPTSGISPARRTGRRREI